MNAKVKPHQPVLGVAKGQGCVVYKKNGQLLGGGLDTISICFLMNLH